MSGKALNLTKLAEHGIAVPAGFYLDDSHYHDAVETIREDLLAGVLNGNPVRHLFETLPLPARTIRAIAEGISRVGGIELTVGPCAAIVSGMVIPDEVLFDRTSGRITECRIGAKECAIEFSPFSRGSENAIKRPLPASVSKRLAVSDDTLAEIIHVAWRVEKVFDSPQDIELVINAEDVITIVQARSITRLPDNIMPFNRLTGHTIRSEETQNA
jgi:phosphoenolpyruvate synthase/pyruvate phosphate dikinase